MQINMSLTDKNMKNILEIMRIYTTSNNDRYLKRVFDLEENTMIQYL